MIASLFNLAGPDLISIFFILLMLGGGLFVVLMISGNLFGSGGSRGSVGPPPIPDQSVEARLRRIDDLKAKGLVSDAEYEEQRRRILSES